MLIQKKNNHLLLKACLMLSLVIFSSYLIIDLGILSLIIDSDRSKISLIILSIYVLACSHWFYISINLDKEIASLDDKDKKTLLTIKRNEVFFEIITHGSLGSTFKFTSEEETIEIEKSFTDHIIYPNEQYKIYEVLRDLKRKVDIIDTSTSSLTWILPPFWLIQNKLWEVLLVTISVYLITFSVAWWMFVITWILLAIYFNKGQTTILRSFSIYRDKHFWLVLAGQNEEQIQKICRNLDPKCNFEYPLLPPIVEEISSKKKRAFI